jgi:hypothetical protein
MERETVPPFVIFSVRREMSKREGVWFLRTLMPMVETQLCVHFEGAMMHTLSKYSKSWLMLMVVVAYSLDRYAIIPSSPFFSKGT